MTTQEEEPAPWLTTAAAADIDEQEIHLFLLAGRLLIVHSEATPRVEHTLYNLAAKLGGRSASLPAIAT